MIEKADVVCIGAGVSGLGFANYWRESHPTDRVLVLEREPLPGGYCRTVEQDGFVWDYSGHFFHFKHPEIEQWLRDRMPGEDLRTVERIARIRFAGRDIDFPFQKHIHQLPLADFLECLTELYFRPQSAVPPRSFGEMLVQRLGKGITEKFLRPYNEKLYATSLDMLDVDAMGRFFPHADLADIIANMRPNASSHGYNATFTYPAGGAIRYIHALMRDLPAGTVACDEPVLAIDLDARTVQTPKRVIEYARLVSSAPLSTLAKLCKVEHDSDVFTSNRVLVFNLGFDKKGKKDVHWIYYPDREIAFYRVGFYDNIFEADRLSLYVEIGFATGAVVDVAAMRERVLADLRKLGVITDHQLVAEHSVIMDPAYVHITRSSLSEHARTTAELRTRGVYSIGRYGGWTYCSIEDNIVEARELVSGGF